MLKTIIRFLKTILSKLTVQKPTPEIDNDYLDEDDWWHDGWYGNYGDQ